jgi:hypothetical protein
MKNLFVLATLTLISSSSFAAGYGSAGCGLGSVVLGDKPGFMQVFAATTNGTSGSQTFGISSGTSNCGSAGKSSEQFIEANKVSLGNDVARGNGETVNSLAEILKVSKKAEFAAVLKAHYAEIFKSADPKVINAKIIEIAQTKKLL